MSAAPRVVDLERERTRRLSSEIERELRQTGVRTPWWRRRGHRGPGSLAAGGGDGGAPDGAIGPVTYVWGREVAVELDLPVTEAEDRRAAQLVANLLGIRSRG